jgi:spore coat polysaccharide biosynthesis predicted glycosyltransferase SpsG
VAVTSGGMTTLESCALGIPQIVISHSAANERSMRYLESKGAIIHLQQITPDLPQVVLSMVKNLMESKQTMREMSEVAMNTIDGKGSERVADILETWGKK